MKNFLRFSPLIGLVLGSCAFLPLNLPTIQKHPYQENNQYQDFRGVVHVHTFLSHDSRGTLEQIVDAANYNGIDFVALTDHYQPGYLQKAKDAGFYGFHNGVLLIPGVELEKDDVDLLYLGLRAELEADVMLIAHPEELDQLPELSFIDGIEIYNLHADAKEELRFPRALLLPLQLLLPERYLMLSLFDYPATNLAYFDALRLQKNVFVGVGACDAHQNINVFGKLFGSYRASFRSVTTHVFAKHLAREEILEAIKIGRSYIVFEMVAPVSVFSFRAENTRTSVMLGGSIHLDGTTRLVVEIPNQTAVVRLLKDGEERAKEDIENKKTFMVREPGNYRVELWKKNHLWILSNPITVQ